MYFKLFLSAVLIDISSSMVVTTYESKADLELIYQQLKQTQSGVFSFKTMSIGFVFCQEILAAKYFLDRGLMMANLYDEAVRNRVSEEMSEDYSLYYVIKGARDVPRTICPARTHKMKLTSSTIHADTISCLGQISKTKNLVQFFVSNGFKRGTYFLYEQDHSGNVLLIGLVEREPDVRQFKSRYILEKLYLSQKRDFEANFEGIEANQILFELTDKEKYRLVSLIFDSDFFKRKAIEFRGGVLDIDYTFRLKKLTYTNRSYSHVDGDIYVFGCTVYSGLTPMTYFVGTSYDSSNSVFLFESFENVEKSKNSDKLENVAEKNVEDQLAKQQIVLYAQVQGLTVLIKI